MQGDADVRALVAQMAQLATVTSTEDLVVRRSSAYALLMPCSRNLRFKSKLATGVRIAADTQAITRHSAKSV